MSRNLQVIGLAFGALWVASSLWAAVPDADHTFYGTPTVDGVLVEEGVVTVAVNQGEPLVSYTLGAVSGYGDRYVVRLPLDFAAPQLPNTARPGDSVSLFLNGELAGVGVVGDPGEAQELDIDPHFDEDPELSIDSIEVFEGDSGTVSAQFKVTLSRPLPFDVQLGFATADGTATAGSDYQATTGNLAIEAFAASVTIDVPVFGDTEAEPPETFTVELQNPIGAVLAQRLGTATIVPDDTEAVLFVSPGQVLEGDLGTVEAVFTVSVCALIPKAAFGTVTVNFTTLDGTAQAGVDYTPVTGALAIDTSEICTGVVEPACESQAVACGTVAVPVLGDVLREGAETFTLQLSDSVGAVLGGSVGQGTIFDDEHILLFREAEIGTDDPGPGELDGLAGASAMVVDPVAGERLYAAARIDGAVTAFDRAADGTLEFVAAFFDDEGTVEGISGAEDLALSPDGKSLYVAGYLDDAVAVFSTAGLCSEALCWQQAETACTGAPACLDGVSGLAVSPDGTSVYAVAFNAGTLVGFTREPTDGLLEVQQVLADEEEGVEGLAGATAVAVSPDGNQIYVASRIDSAVVMFDRQASGTLTMPAGPHLYKDGVGGVDGLAGAGGLALSADGSFLYVAGEQDDAVAVFSRDPVTGELTWLQQRRNNIGGVRGLAGVSGVALSADGTYLVTSSRIDAAVALFARDQTTGRLTFLEARFDGEPEIGDRTVDGLHGGSAVSVGPEDDGRSVYVAGSDDNGVAVFVKDTDAPEPPVLWSSSHQVGIWSGNSRVEVRWTADDSEGGSGIAGYSFLFDELPDTDPGIELDMEHDPSLPHHETASGSLADGNQYYFHALACDQAGNCSAPAHFGPFFIDTVDPTGPSNVVSTSHVVGEISELGEITMIWDAAQDAGSGIDGYAAIFNMRGDLNCSAQVKNLEADAITTTSPVLESDIWFFHICALDNAGNWSSSQSFGPYVLDSIPPVVLGVSSIASSETGALGNASGTAVAITQLLIGFSESMSDPAGDSDPQDVTNPSNYLLAEAGENGDRETASCGALGGDDVAFSVDFVTYDLGTSTSALRVHGAASLPRGHYRLFACGVEGLEDIAGNALDGDGDSSGGDDFSLDFGVTSTNFLVNPNFDDDLEGWTPVSPEPNEINYDPADADDAATSGSTKFSNFTGPNATYGLTQCLTVAPFTQLDLGARFKIDSNLEDDPLVFGWVQFFPTDDCSGPGMPPLLTEGAAGDSQGVWGAIKEPAIMAPNQVLSAQVSLQIDAGASPDFAVFSDSAFFRESLLIFIDGFESGDFSAWSSVVP